ncbi:hypothetical protein [Microcoleus sp. D3_18a_C4]|uniref:hypothetical protein n=1 Tax=unclassified Microcoleus TaxID=2642155 RepID=UPI002FD2908D
MQNTDKTIIAHKNDIDSLSLNLFSPRAFIPTLTFGRARDFPFALVKAALLKEKAAHVAQKSSCTPSASLRPKLLPTAMDS